MKISRLWTLAGLPLLLVACAPAEDDTVDLDETVLTDTMVAPEAAPMETDMAGMEDVVDLMAVNNSGATGEATFTAMGEETQVVLQVADAPADATLPAHIHAASCETGGGVEYPLEEVTTDADGMGTSTSTVAAPIATVMNGEHYIQAHDPEGTPISCGDIPQMGM